MATVKNEISFRQVIRTNVALLKCSGTIPPEDKTPLKMFFSYCLTIISVAVLVMHTSVYGYDFCIHAAYIETAIESFALVMAFFGGLVHTLILYWWRRKIQKILNTLENLWEILNFKERRYITSYMKGAQNLTYFLLSQCIFTIFFYAMTPLLFKSTDADLNVTRILPYAFFTEVHHSPYYEILYFVQVSSIFNASFTCVGVDMIGPLLITAMCGHLRVIQEKLKNIDCRLKDQSSRKTEGSVPQTHGGDGQAMNERPEVGKSHFFESVSSELRFCVNYHRLILTICQDIEQTTNVIFLTQLVGSTYTLSAVGFKLAGGDQDKFKYISQIIIGMVQLLICNWPPDVLLTELFNKCPYERKNLWLSKSQAVADAAYFAPWYQWPSELQKSVHIVILRARKPIQLTAGKFMYLSLETFTSMVSTAVSFFTMLRSFK